MKNMIYNKWVMELANQEYSGNVKELSKVLK